MKIWRTKPFPLYDKILPRCGGKVYKPWEQAFNVGESYDDDIDGAVENDFVGDPLPGLDWPDSDEGDIPGNADDEESDKDVNSHLTLPFSPSILSHLYRNLALPTLTVSALPLFLLLWHLRRRSPAHLVLLPSWMSPMHSAMSPPH